MLPVLLVALAPAMAAGVVLRDYRRTLETARHAWWMWLIGRDATTGVIAGVLGATRLFHQGTPSKP